MRPEEVSIAVNWAAAEGWNPGLSDDACFAVADPEGFWIGELDGAPAATVSCVNYGASFAFLGFYIVREDLRGRGYGLRIWNAAIAHAGGRVIGLDGVVAQQQNYMKSAFALAYANIRYGGTVAASSAPQAVDPTRDYVDGVRTREPVTESQRMAVLRLNRAERELGADGAALVHDVLIKGMTMDQVGQRRALSSQRWYDYFSRRFRECLDRLALVYGFATKPK